MHVAEGVSGAFGLTQCPGCDKWVVPTGEACPNCEFPISRYLSRMRALPRLLIGLAMLILSAVFFLFLVVPHGDAMRWLVVAWLLITFVGVALVAVGAYGVLLGGRHTAGQSLQSSAWKGGKRVALEDEPRRAAK